MKFDAVITGIFGAINLGATLIELIHQIKPEWTGGPKLANELRAVADNLRHAMRTDPVFKAEIDAGNLSHIWTEDPPA